MKEEIIGYKDQKTQQKKEVKREYDNKGRSQGDRCSADLGSNQSIQK